MVARIRKDIIYGWTPLTDGELSQLDVGMIRLKPGQTFDIKTRAREFAFVLIHGECDISLASGLEGSMGPRGNPFEDPPFGLFVTRDEQVTFIARAETLIGAGSAPAAGKMTNRLVHPEDTGGGRRGADNWERLVRFVCWNDNTEGNMLMAGETCTPSGNWSSVPPHRHQIDTPGEEVPYEEAYFFQFSRPEGFGLLRDFDAGFDHDEAHVIRHNDLFCIPGNYHPLVCGPGATLYHLTFMAGPRRMSQSSVHPAYMSILEDRDMPNPFRNQSVKAGSEAAK